MNILLDTHALLWALAGDAKLPTTWAKAIEMAENRVYVSAISLAEIAIKSSLGKLVAPQITSQFLIQHGYELLDFTADHAQILRELPWIHRDPFDRMLICQSIATSFPIATQDARIAQYEVAVFH